MNPGREGGWMGVPGREDLVHKGEEACLVCLGIVWLCQMFKTGKTEGKTEEAQGTMFNILG